MSPEPAVICSHADVCEQKKPCPHKQPHQDDLSCRLAEKNCVWFAARCLPPFLRHRPRRAGTPVKITIVCDKAKTCPRDPKTTCLHTQPHYLYLYPGDLPSRRIHACIHGGSCSLHTFVWVANERQLP